MKLAEALAPDLPPEKAEAVLDEYLPLYNSFYMANMRRKLGLILKEEPEDEMLITQLMQTMHDTGTAREEVTNVYHFLSFLIFPFDHSVS